jgi:cobalt-zinc-cadmium efflux system membrane fusion protein
MHMANSAAIDSRAATYRTTVARALSALALLAVCLAGAGCSDKTDTAAAAAKNGNVRLTPQQRQNVRLFTVVSAKFHRNTETTGVVDFDNDQATSVLAPFSGPVSRLLVGLGERVKMGDPLALVDSPDFAEAISTYQKALATAQTNRRLADLDKDLLEHNGVAQREAAQAETDAVNAEADRDAALQALISLNVNPQTIEDLRAGRPVRHATAVIRAPIAGTVVEKLITPGQLLSGGTTPCFTVANLSRVWVMAQVFGSDLSAVSPGDPAEVSGGIGSDTLPGKVDNISALVDADTRAVAVRVVVENPKQLLKKQMYVRVSIRASAQSDGLLVPVSAILRDDENLPFVYVAESDGSFARRHVTLGFRAGEQYDIADGLKVGDQIVVAGGIFVQFMQSQ